ncbi:MAG: tetraacyldisaccharide 4'-kinase [Dysgonamonadaceae bacterium]|jgi:tetraacyldisaccharide 4'-kinase|nr:tetraacyldisaccharide 4'-kinase [Dysgonamonadaceae bacterium]
MPSFNRLLCLPLSRLYGLAVELRNKLFDRRILPSETFPVPVISIGNLAVGGTGKTPHTEYLIRLLSKKYKVAVLSRGYKRKSKGFVLAGENASAESIGDEPYQMFRKFPAVSVAVDGNRRRGIRNLLNPALAQVPDVILLDDAFQHRYVTPSLSILLTDCSRLFSEDKLLPAGRLREPPKNKKRAQMLVVTKCPFPMEQTHCQEISEKLALLPGQDLFFTSYKYKNLLPVFGESNPVKKESIDRLKKEACSAVLLAGLANPSGLIQYLSAYIPDLQTLIYPDHHTFSRKDLRKLSETFDKIENAKKIIITSEKDAVRLLDCPHVPETIKSVLFYLPVEVVFNQDKEELFIQTIENHVTTFERNRILA